jgi:hypothetical protein
LFYFALDWFVETQIMAYFVDVGCATRQGIWVSAHQKFQIYCFISHLIGLWRHKPWHILLMSGAPPAKGFE